MITPLKVVHRYTEWAMCNKNNIVERKDLGWFFITNCELLASSIILVRRRNNPKKKWLPNLSHQMKDRSYLSLGHTFLFFNYIISQKLANIWHKSNVCISDSCQIALYIIIFSRVLLLFFHKNAKVYNWIWKKKLESIKRYLISARVAYFTYIIQSHSPVKCISIRYTYYSGADLS